jgi:hypothetical protein
VTAQFTKVFNFVLALGDDRFVFASDTFKVFLTDVQPNVATVTTYSSVSSTEIPSGNGYVTGGATIGGISWSQSGGVATLSGNATGWTASGGSISQFRYEVLYDSTTGYVVGYWDYGSEVNVTNGATFTIEPNGQSTGGTILTVT